MLDTEAGAGRSPTSVVRALAGCDVCVTCLRAGCVIGICLEMFREALMEHRRVLFASQSTSQCTCAPWTSQITKMRVI